MSVINRMLQELEERHDDATQNRLPGIVRAVPARVPHIRRPPWIVLIVGLAILIPVLAWQAVAIRTTKSEIVLPPVAITPPLVLAAPTLKAEDQLKPSFLKAPEAGLPLSTEPAPPVPLEKASPEKITVTPTPSAKQKPGTKSETTTLQTKAKPEPTVAKSVPKGNLSATRGLNKNRKSSAPTIVTAKRYRLSRKVDCKKRS